MDARASDYEKSLQAFPVDGDGNPTSAAAYGVITWLFRHRDQQHHVDDLASDLSLPLAVVATICRRLTLVDLLLENPPHSRTYRYNLKCWDTELQAKVESALVDCQPHPPAPQS